MVMLSASHRKEWGWAASLPFKTAHSLKCACSSSHEQISKAAVFPLAGVSLSQIVSCSLERLNKTKRQTNPPGTERERKYSSHTLQFCPCLILSSLASSKWHFLFEVDSDTEEGSNSGRIHLLRIYCHLLVLGQTDYQSIMFFVLYCTVQYIALDGTAKSMPCAKKISHLRPLDYINIPFQLLVYFHIVLLTTTTSVPLMVQLTVQ